MKVQILEKGGKYFLRGWFLSFIPVYFDDGYAGGWSLYPYDIEKSRADQLLTRWKERAVERKAYKESKTKIVTEADI